MRPSRRAPPTGGVRRDRLDADRPGGRACPEQAEPGVEALLRGGLEVAGHWSTEPLATAGALGQGRSAGSRSVADARAAARAPAEIPSQPSIGQVLE